MEIFDNIFKPIKFGKLTAKNRIEVSPAEPFTTTEDGYITNEFIAYTASMAKGGAGIVTVGDSPVTKEYASHSKYVVDLSNKYVVHGLFNLTDAIHRYGSLASIELNLRDEEHLPADYSKEDIKYIVKSFADAAENCKLANFDMIMIHGGHGHTVANFFSPAMNKRTDEYGCDSIENRSRFAREILLAVRERIGYDMAIEWRISGDELTENGVGIDDAIKYAKAIQDKVDLMHVSAGNLYNLAVINMMIQPAYVPMATNLHLAERFKKELDIPVVTVGSFNMELAEQAISEGKADMVAMIRSFIADPDLVNKARLGKTDEIRPCIRCCICTGGSDPHACPKPIRCTVNPMVGREWQLTKVEKAETSKKVLIIGGGCAGMEAARRLVERGHRPIIIEKEDKLGGSLIPAASNPIKGDIKRYFHWTVNMTNKTKVIEVRLNTTATKELIIKENPDAIIIAAGASPIIPSIPGINSKNVVLAADVDTGKAKVGKNVVLAGAGLTGTETAYTLAKSGHNVTIIDMLTINEIDAKGAASKLVSSTLRAMIVAECVKVIEKVRLTEITDKGAVITKEDGSIENLECDTVILSLGVRPNSKAADDLAHIIDETYIVGDCRKTGNITSAVREGFYAAINI